MNFLTSLGTRGRPSRAVPATNLITKPEKTIYPGTEARTLLWLWRTSRHIVMHCAGENIVYKVYACVYTHYAWTAFSISLSWGPRITRIKRYRYKQPTLNTWTVVLPSCLFVKFPRFQLTRTKHNASKSLICRAFRDTQIMHACTT